VCFKHFRHNINTSFGEKKLGQVISSFFECLPKRQVAQMTSHLKHTIFWPMLLELSQKHSSLFLPENHGQGKKFWCHFQTLVPPADLRMSFCNSSTLSLKTFGKVSKLCFLRHWRFCKTFVIVKFFRIVEYLRVSSETTRVEHVNGVLLCGQRLQEYL
jgi:hypothetical protein